MPLPYVYIVTWELQHTKQHIKDFNKGIMKINKHQTNDFRLDQITQSCIMTNYNKKIGKKYDYM